MVCVLQRDWRHVPNLVLQQESNSSSTPEAAVAAVAAAAAAATGNLSVHYCYVMHHACSAGQMQAVRQAAA
jgi:hypothetical protein